MKVKLSKLKEQLCKIEIKILVKSYYKIIQILHIKNTPNINNKFSHKSPKYNNYSQKQLPYKNTMIN